MEWLGQKQLWQHGLAEQTASCARLALCFTRDIPGTKHHSHTRAPRYLLLTHLGMPPHLFNRHQEAKGTIFGEAPLVLQFQLPALSSILVWAEPHSTGPLPGRLHIQCRNAGNEKPLPKEPCAIFPASPSSPASRSPPFPRPHLSLTGHTEESMMLAQCSRLPGTLTRSSCQAFQGSLSLSRGWKCKARDKLPWQPHCFQTLKGREKSRLLPAHQSHHRHGCWPRCPNNNCGPTGHMCSLGTKGDRAFGATGTEQRREKKWGFFLHCSSQQILHSMCDFGEATQLPGAKLSSTSTFTSNSMHELVCSLFSRICAGTRQDFPPPFVHCWYRQQA